MPSRPLSSVLALAVALQGAPARAAGGGSKGRPVAPPSLPASVPAAGLVPGLPSLPASATTPGSGPAVPAGASAPEGGGPGGAGPSAAESPASPVTSGQAAPSAPSESPGPAPEPPSSPRRALMLLGRLTGVSPAWTFLRHGFEVQRRAAELSEPGRAPEERAEAARRLGELRRPEAIEALGAAAFDGSEEVRAAAEASLESLSARWTPVLGRQVRAGLLAGSRASAARELGVLLRSRPDSRGIEALADAAALDRDLDVRLTAVEALSRVPHRRALASLSALRDAAPEPALRSSLELALARLSGTLAGGTAFLYTPPAGEFESAKHPLYIAALKRVIAINSVFALIEFIGGAATGSLSLKADATHLAADLAISAGALLALWVSRRPPNSRKTYGYLKAEPLAGLLSAAAIGGFAVHTAVEAVGRLWAPAPVPGLAAILLAFAGLAANGVATALLYRHREENLSMKGAFLHAATDAAGSVAIILGGGLMLAFGWFIVDPILSLLIVGLIAKTTWDLGRRSWAVLLDGVPPGVSLDEVEKDLLAAPGVAAVHDLHVWSLNSTERILTAVLYLRPGADGEAAREAAASAARSRHGIRHATIEVRLLPHSSR